MPVLTSTHSGEQALEGMFRSTCRCPFPLRLDELPEASPPADQMSDGPPQACCKVMVYVGHTTEEDGEEAERVDVPRPWCLKGWESMLRLIHIPGRKA